MDDNSYEKEVRNVIERNTTKISLKDLEKKGFKNVKVLRQNDINLLIKQALDRVLGSQIESADISDQEREAYFKETKQEVQRLIKKQQAEAKKYARLENENKRLVEQVKILEKKAKGASGLAGKLQQMSSSSGDPERVKNLESEIVRLRGEIKKLESQAASGGAGAPTADPELAAKVQELEPLKEEKEKLEATLQEKQEALEKAQSDYRAQKEALQKAETELAQLREEHDSKEDGEKAKNLEIQNDMLRQEKEKLQAQLTKFKDIDPEKIEKVQSEKEELAEKVESLRKQNELLEEKVENEKKKSQAFEGMNPEEVSSLRKKTEELTTKLEETTKEKDKLEKEDLVDLKCEVTALQTKLEEAQKAREKLENEEVPNRQKEIMELKAELFQERQEKKELHQKIEDLQSQPAAQAGGGGAAGMDSSQIVNTIVQQLKRAGLTGAKAKAVAGEVNLDSLFQYDDDTELESNIKNINVKEKKSGGLKSQLARLKSLKGGNQDDKQG